MNEQERATMTTKPSLEEWSIFRIGAVAGMVGSLLAMVGNLLHPAAPTGNPEGVARTIAQSANWVFVHLVIVVGLILMLGALVALSRSIEGGVPGALAWLGSIAAVAGVTVGVILVIVDGVAAKHLADAWEAAPPEEEAVALRVVVAEEAINFALASLFNILFAGVTSVPVGLVQAYMGESIGFTRIATIIFPTIITLWVVVMSVLLWRKAGKSR